jgi:hypothetical protein
VKKKRPDAEMTFTNDVQTLWENFEQTGSIEVYLRYTNAVENKELQELVDLPR